MTRSLLALLLTLVSCASVPAGQRGVERMALVGNRELSDHEILRRLATAPSPRLLGIWQEVLYDPVVFNRYVFESDLQRVQRLYQSEGFYRARVFSGAVVATDEQHIATSLRVDEGPATTIGNLTTAGVDSLAAATRAAIRDAADLEVGERFVEERFVQAEAGMQQALTRRGYPRARVARSARVDLHKHRADLAFSITPGPAAVYGRVQLTGSGVLPEAPIVRALNLQPGQPYSSEEVQLAQLAVLQLGVFQSATVEPNLGIDRPPRPADGQAGQPPEAEAIETVDIHVELKPTELKSVRLGGGVRLDNLQTDAHAVAGWENRNFLGGLRRLNLELRPGAVWFPTRVDNLQTPTHLLPQLGLLAELSQPGLFEARTSGTLRSQYSVYPVINPNRRTDNILGYREALVQLSLNRNFGQHWHLSPSQTLQTNTGFAYVGQVPDDLRPLIISISQVSVEAQFLDHVLSPRSGLRAGVELQYAGLGGDARDVRVSPTLRGYLPVAPATTLALKASAGALFPQNYQTNGRDVRDEQIALFRGFFAGGGTSNRGYAVRGIGPASEGTLFYGNPNSDCDGDGECLSPRGGASLWEASAELRFSFGSELGLTLFCDAADVSSATLDFRVRRPHLACGPGFRYQTPVGPFRADLGYRVPGAQTFDGSALTQSPQTLGGLPLAIAFGIGEAF